MTGSELAALLQNILYAAAPLIALTNPIAELPVFLAIVKDRPLRDVRRAALRVTFGVFVVLMVAALTGTRLLDLIGIELPAFRAAGGLLLILMGLEMLQGREPLTQMDSSDPDTHDALWVPLVMPMLAGPGAIVTTVSLTIREPASRLIPVATISAITLSALVVYLTLTLSTAVAHYIGQRGIRIFTRFSGMIVVAIGFQMGFTGAAEFFGL